MNEQLLTPEFVKRSMAFRGHNLHLSDAVKRDIMQTVIEEYQAKVQTVIEEYQAKVLRLQAPSDDKLREEKPPILALVDTLTWGGKLYHRKVFRKEQIIELVKQFMGDQRDADVKFLASRLLNARREGQERILSVLSDYYDLFADEFCEKYGIKEKNPDMWDAKTIIRQALFPLQRGDDKLREEINRVIEENIPCYRDLFGIEGGCAFDTGCEKCPDYFNVRQDIVARISSLLASCLLNARKEERERIKQYVENHSEVIDWESELGVMREMKESDWQALSELPPVEKP